MGWDQGTMHYGHTLAAQPSSGHNAMYPPARAGYIAIKNLRGDAGLADGRNTRKYTSVSRAAQRGDTREEFLTVRPRLEIFRAHCTKAPSKRTCPMETSRRCDWWATEKWTNNGEKARRRVLFPAYTVELLLPLQVFTVNQNIRNPMAPATRTSARTTCSQTKNNPAQKPTVQPARARSRRKPTAKAAPQEEQNAASHILSDDETKPQQEEDIEPPHDEEMIEPPPLDEDDNIFNPANQNETAPNEKDLADEPSGEDEPSTANAGDTTRPKPRVRDKNATNPQKDPFDLSGRWDRHRDEQRTRLSKRQLYLANPLQRLQDDKDDHDFQDKTGVGYNIDPYPSPRLCPRSTLVRSRPSERPYPQPVPLAVGLARRSWNVVPQNSRSSPLRAHSVSPVPAAHGRGRSPRRPERPSLSPPPAANPSRPRSVSTPSRRASLSSRHGRSALPRTSFFKAATPLPPSSPILESDLSQSEDNYHAHQEVKRKSKQYKVDRGRSHSPDTEDEDEEENRDFDAEIQEQGLEDEGLTQPRPKKSAPKKTKPPTTKAAKATSSKAAPA
ncbi:hypothetical protein K438DRAFT_1760063 [Mycena galopus ATCC 62051]|nr:hypothetical protein K438DRAFT_1760063 [Mycena galopus ATCC 62051]